MSSRFAPRQRVNNYMKFDKLVQEMLLKKGQYVVREYEDENGILKRDLIAGLYAPKDMTIEELKRRAARDDKLTNQKTRAVHIYNSAFEAEQEVEEFNRKHVHYIDDGMQLVPKNPKDIRRKRSYKNIEVHYIDN